MQNDRRKYAATGVVALTGAALAALAGIPAGALIGSTLAVSALAAMGQEVGLPNRFRDLAFATIGVSLGAGIDESFVSHIGTWAVSLGILVASLVATISCGRLILTRGFGLDAQTATLASAPGTMSNAIAIAGEGHGDATAVMFLQLMRLLFLVVAVPPLAVALDASATSTAAAAHTMALPTFMVTLALSAVIGWLGGLIGVPAASLLAGMMVSASGHATGLIEGLAPSWAIFIAFSATGAALSTRMSRVTTEQAKRYAVAGFSIVATSLVVSFLFALIAQAATGLSLSQVWIAYAPGGVEAMAAIGLSLGYEPAYIAVHHFARIFALLLLVPIFLTRWV